MLRHGVGAPQHFGLFLFHQCFTRESYDKEQPLWTSVVKELRWLWALLTVAVTDTGREWSTSPVAYDASPSGLGICDTKSPS